MQPTFVARVLRPLAPERRSRSFHFDIRPAHVTALAGPEHVASEDIAGALARQGAPEAVVWLRLDALDADPRCLMESLSRAENYARRTGNPLITDVDVQADPDIDTRQVGTHRDVGRWLADVLGPSSTVILEDEWPNGASARSVDVLDSYVRQAGDMARAVYLCHGRMQRDISHRTSPIIDDKHLVEALGSLVESEPSRNTSSLARLSTLVEHRSVLVNDIVDATALRDCTLPAQLMSKRLRRRSLPDHINAVLLPQVSPAEVQALAIAVGTGYWHPSLSDRAPPDAMTLRPWMVPLEHDWWWMRPMWRPSLSRLLDPARRGRRNFYAGYHPLQRVRLWLESSTDFPAVVVPPSVSSPPVVEPTEVSAQPSTFSLDVRMLGVFEVTIDGVPVPRWHGRLGRSILAYLLLQHRCVPRDRLMEVFWPEVDPKVGQNRLRVAVSSLRRSLRAASDRHLIEFLDGNYRITPNCDVTLDVDRFERCAHTGRRAEALQGPDDALHSYRQALDCYQGELLAEMPYEDWTILPREALRVSYLECLGNAASLCMERGNHSETLTLAWQILAEDPAREDAHRLIISCHVAKGDLRQARRQLDLCCHEMSSILGAEPSSSTVDLIRSIETRS